MTSGQILFLVIFGVLLVPALLMGALLVLMLWETIRRLDKVLEPFEEAPKSAEQEPEEPAAFSRLDQACEEKGLDILVGKHPEFDLFSVIQKEQDVVPLAKHLLDLTEDYSPEPLQGDEREAQITFLATILSFFYENIVSSDQTLDRVFFFIQKEQQALEKLTAEGKLWRALPPSGSYLRHAMELFSTEEDFCQQRYRCLKRQVGTDYGEIVLDSFHRLSIFCPDVPLLTS